MGLFRPCDLDREVKAYARRLVAPGAWGKRVFICLLFGDRAASTQEAAKAMNFCSVEKGEICFPC